MTVMGLNCPADILNWFLGITGLLLSPFKAKDGSLFPRGISQGSSRSVMGGGETGSD